MKTSSATAMTSRKSLREAIVSSSTGGGGGGGGGVVGNGSREGGGDGESENGDMESNASGTTPPRNPNHSTTKFDFGKCKVCHDLATGIHYGIPSCEGCKGFYKRSVDKYHKYVCYFGSKCTITPRQRRRCKLCRWRSCVAAGMSFDAIKMGRISKADKEKVKRLIERDDDEANDHVATAVAAAAANDDEHCAKRARGRDKSGGSSEGVVARAAFDFEDEERILLELREKCFEAYEEFSRDMVEVYQRAINCLKINKPEPLPADRIDQETIQLIWQHSLHKLSENTKNIVFYIKSLPGFSQLDIADLAALFEEHTGTLLGLKITRSFIGGEVFFLISYNLRMTRGLVARLMGITIQERIFTFHERFHELGVSEREMALLMPAIMSHVAEKLVLKNPNQVMRLHEIYKKALKVEFDMNKRSPEFIQELIETLKLVPIKRHVTHANSLTDR